MARVRAAGPVVAASEPAEAEAEARANVQAGVDWLKVRVDDNLGTTAKMSPACRCIGGLIVTSSTGSTPCGTASAS